VLTVLAMCLAFAAPAIVLGVVFSLPGWVAALGEARRRRLRRLGRLLVAPGPPLERLVADLRRLRIQRADPRRSWVQREGARLAYEDVLCATANALGIAHDLAGARGALARELEMLRVEQALLGAGLVLSG
jgi:hypothetical protein